MTNIGFIGLGNMGIPMAQLLIKEGHQVVGFDVLVGAQEAAITAGMTIEKSNIDLARRSDVVILMLPNGDIVNQVADEILAVMPANSLLIDCSTIDMANAQLLHKKAQSANILCLDAPVSGGVGGAVNGTLTFMVGGSEKSFQKGLPFFEIMGQKAVFCGQGGSGQAAKICNNMLLAISMQGTCESFALAQKLGLNLTALFDVISNSSGSCWSVNTYCPVPGIGPQSPADNDYKAGFAAALMLKDLKLSQIAASSVKANTPLGQHATELFSKMVDAGHGDKDFSGIIKFMK